MREGSCFGVRSREWWVSRVIMARGALFIYLGTPQDAVVTIGRSELTVHLHNSWGLRQELQARLARGESVEVPIPKRREELLRAVEAARAAEPAIPTPLDAPPPPQAAAPAAQAPAAQAPVAQALVVLDASLVGRRVLALWGDPDDTPPSFSWYPATIVKYRTGSRVKYKYLLHFMMAPMTSCSSMMRTSRASRYWMSASSGAPATSARPLMRPGARCRCPDNGVAQQETRQGGSCEGQGGSCA